MLCLVTNSVCCPSSVAQVLLTLLSNISPYLTKLSLFASVKLLNLFELFTSPKFLYANQTNHQYATMMLDILSVRAAAAKRTRQQQREELRSSLARR